MKKIERIKINEERLDNILKSVKELELSLNKFKNQIKDINKLNKYYGSKIWFKDYDDYNNGRLSKIKAGVLSEDSIWNMNENVKELMIEMKNISSKILKTDI